MILRLYAWKNTVLLEDHGSLSKLEAIKVFLTFNLQNIINLDPDRTLFYEFFGALFSLPGWSLETGARLCSLFFSSLLFLAVIGIGKQIAKPLEVAMGLLILSLSPVLISLSFSVLLEPSYIAMIYLGMWLFWNQYKDPNLWKAGFLGIIFGLSFLSRVEGIMYVIIIPLLQGLYLLFSRYKHYGFNRFIVWAITFVFFFSLMAIPQIWRVSYKIGDFALNGRQVWSVLLNYPDGKSREEKVYGLDYSPSQINISYLMNHPEEVNKLVSNRSKMYLLQYLKNAVLGFTDFYDKKLGILIGSLGLIFFAFGLLALYQKGYRFETLLILAFIGFNLVPPLSHNFVAIRHIAIIAPIIMLMEGVGIFYLSDKLLENTNFYLGKYILPFIFLFCLVGASAVSLLNTFRPPSFNGEYSLSELKEPMSIINKISEKELLISPVIASRKGYLAYFTGGKQVCVPYIDYEGLVKYCELNKVYFLYLKHELLVTYPFMADFLRDQPPRDFVLIYSGVDPYGKKIELYRFKNIR